MTYTNIGICSNALLKIGAEGITSFEDGTAEAEIAYSLYPLLRDGLLSAYPWSFAKAQKTCRGWPMFRSPIISMPICFRMTFCG